MEHQEVTIKTAAVFLLSVFSAFILSGCATMKEIHESFVESLRKPGETMAMSPEETVEYYSCSSEKQGMPVLFETEVIPFRIKPGKEINNRISYAFCPASVPTKQNGEIIRIVKYRNHVIFRDKAIHEFKPGTWTIDAFINVPENAGAGEYIVETTIVFRGKALKKNNTFQVREK